MQRAIVGADVHARGLPPGEQEVARSVDEFGGRELRTRLRDADARRREVGATPDGEDAGLVEHSCVAVEPAQEAHELDEVGVGAGLQVSVRHGVRG